jgi:hypothetical protein
MESGIFAVFGGIGLSWRRFPNLMRQSQKVFSSDLAALLKDKMVDRTALGSRRHFAYLDWFVVKLRPSAFII